MPATLGQATHHDFAGVLTAPLYHNPEAGTRNLAAIRERHVQLPTLDSAVHFEFEGPVVAASFDRRIGGIDNDGY